MVAYSGLVKQTRPDKSKKKTTMKTNINTLKTSATKALTMNHNASALKTFSRKTALGALLGIAALSLVPKTAHAQFPGNTRCYKGFSWNAVLHNPPADCQLRIATVQPSGFSGQLLLGGSWHSVMARTAPDGSVDMNETGVARPLHLMGKLTPTGNGVSRVLLSYQGSDGAVNFVELLSTVPPDPYSVAIPPDPYFTGGFHSRTGATGSMSLTFNPSPVGEHNPPDGYTGKLTMGERSYMFVATVSPRQNEDGSFNFDLIAVDPGSDVPSVHVTGKLIPAGIEIAPCVKPTGHIFASYETLALLPAVRSIDAGTLDISGL